MIFSPGGIQSIILSAAELDSGSVISMASLTAFSANLSFHPRPGAPPGIVFPLVQGMGFVTATYLDLRPWLQSSVFFRDITRVTSYARAGVIKFRITLEDGKTVGLLRHARVRNARDRGH
jgi:endo-1,3(4)-beta-glucanase